MIDNIMAYSCGMGYSKLNFVEFKSVDGNLLPIPYYLPFEGDHIEYSRASLKEKKRTYSTVKKLLIILFGSIAFIELIVIILLWKKKRK